MSGADFVPPLSGIRKDLKLFRLSSEVPNSWEQVPFQIDPLDNEQQFLFFQNDEWKNQEVAPNDRFAFRMNDLNPDDKIGAGRLMGKDDDPPCAIQEKTEKKDSTKPVLYEVRDRINRSNAAYLTFCNQTFKVKKDPDVIYSEKNLRVESKSYRFQFNRSNHLLFDGIALKKEGQWEQIARKADLILRADFKKFFTFHFNNNDVRSELSAYRMGPVALVGKVSFFLKILFFKIELALKTDVAFFEKSAFIPMTMHLPRNAPDTVHPGSGIAYGWNFPMKFKRQIIEMPAMNDLLAKSIKKKDLKTLSKISTTRCKDQTCNYRFLGESREKAISMDFSLPKKVVDKKFFPIFIDDMEKYNKEMDWGFAKSNEEKRQGVYFESSQLSKGSHQWDFWMRVGNSKEDLKGTCPHPVIPVRKS